ncbi:protein TIME FOR COFFEE-like isoform X2 [Bidens hawaiensis]|uniref:protein TIME FOR COFFEE-like isoform X2 n=1 Tax=Bidens hawaiensis TaxID=980011 RepID=UPI0040493066
MDRNREGRRVSSSNNNNNNMAAPPNGLSRRRHRSSSLRDSPEQDGTVEVPEPGRLRDRGLVKKDRDRERERERDRSSRSKRRRENRMVMSNRDDGDDTSEESVNDEDEEDDVDAGNGSGLRMLPPAPAMATVNSLTSGGHNSHPPQIHHRKSFPPVNNNNNKVFRGAAAAPVPAWKAADEMIGVSVPRKARSASTKRSHEWISGVANSTSPATVTANPSSPSSSNVSIRKKMKSNGGGGGSNSRPKPPKSSSKSSSSNPEELEIEIAEVLYGLMTQSQAPSKKEITSNDSSMKFDSNKSSSEAKSRVSSPVSNSTAVPQNSTSLSAAAPKRKRPRPVSETNPINARNCPVEIDHNQHHQSPKTDNSSDAAVENGGSSFGFTTLPGQKASPSPTSEQPTAVLPAEEERKCGVNVLTKEEVEKESKVVKLNDGNSKVETVIKTAASTTVTNLKVANLDTQSQKDEKFEIDLMAPPPQSRTFHGNDQDNDFSDHKQIANQETSKIKDDDKLKKSEKEEPIKLSVDQKTGTIREAGESLKQAVNEEINIQLNIDSEKSNKGSGNGNRSLHQALKHQQLSAKSESHSDKTAQSGSMPMPMSMANWPPMGYVAPLQGVISMDGNPMASAPIQPLLSHPRPKRCATHCYIARNIHYNQQFMKINPFWPAASGSAPPMFGAKPSNFNVMPGTELHANIPQSVHEKGPPAGIFPGHITGKDTKSSQPTNVTDPAQRKQQVLLQQAMPPVVPNNILHGPAFIFPFNQQQAVVASASVRPGSSKVTTTTAGGSGAASSTTVSSSTTAAAPALSFNYPNISASETQYLAILQNNPYTFPIPAAGGAPPNYRPSPHAQAMPLFNGSFYSSQMMHPSQIPQPQAPPVAQSQTHQNSSGSTSSSQKHLQGQQRQQASGAAAVNSGGSLHNTTYHAAHKSRSQPPVQQQNQHMNPSTGGEDSPSTADSRGSRAGNPMGVYNHNFPMPVRSKGLGQMDHSNGALKAAAANNAAASANSNDKKQPSQLQQQGLKRGGAESSLPPQTFAMSFAPMNGTTGTPQNHAIFQSLPESLKPSFHMMSAPTSSTAHHSQQKDFRITEEASRTTVTGHDASGADEDRKAGAGLTAKSGQSIAFSRPDLATDGSSGSNNRSSRAPISTSNATAAQSSHSLNAQFQQTQQQALERARQHHQQQALQIQKGQQLSQAINAYAMGGHARSKNPPSSNGSAYPEHTITSSSMTAKFPNSVSSFPLQTSNPSNSQVQSPQWRNSVRGPTTSQVPSSLASATSSSAKNLHQSQPSSRSHPQSHTQISFGSTASQKLQPTTSVQMQQQQQQQNPGSNSGNRCSSPPMRVGSPTTSMSKGGGSGGGSPRTNAAASTSGRTGQASSLSSSQQAKNSPVPQRSSPSILGNPNNSNSTKSQQQLQKQALQQQQQKVQAMMMYNHPYMQAQAQAQVQQQHAANSLALYRMQQQQQQSSSSSSTATLSLCPPVTNASAATSDPAKAIAAATGMMNHPQYNGPPPSMPAGFPQYVHNAPVAAAAAAVQVKPAEQKQPAA